MYDIAALGELLIDFTPCGKSNTGMKLLEVNPGGAVANVLCAASRLGLSTAFIGKVGRDINGSYLKNKLDEYGIDSSGLVVSDEAPTTLAFVDIDAQGERSFSFVRSPGADTLLREDELSDTILLQTHIFHVGSLSLTAEPSRSATFEAIRRARASGAIITYDPNYRAMLWESEDEAMVQMRSLIPYVDMIKLSDNETCLLTGEVAPESAIGALISSGLKCVVVTSGEQGAYVGVGEEITHVESFRRKAVDSTGAGDAFWGGFLTSFIRNGLDVNDLRLGDVRSCAEFGCAVAACCVASRGAMPAMPDIDAVNAVLEER